MKKFLTAAFGVAAMVALGSAAQADVVIGGAVGNANFQATTTYTGNTATFDDTPGWVNLGGSDASASFGAQNQLNNSPDPNHGPTQGAFLSVGNEAANTTGHTVLTAGEVFDASLFWAATGGSAGYGDADPNAPGNGNLDDESFRIFLFTAPAAVDDTTTFASITELASASQDLDRLENGTLTANGLYTTTAADIGSTVYFGIQLLNPTGGNPFPRVDLATLDVTPVPEPGSVALLGLVGLVGLVRRKRA